MPKFPTENVPKWDMFDHGVNNAMGTKSCATWMRQSHNETEGNRSYQKLEMQDMYHGQVRLAACCLLPAVACCLSNSQLVPTLLMNTKLRCSAPRHVLR